MVFYIVLGIVLFLLSVEDIKTKRISFIKLAGFIPIVIMQWSFGVNLSLIQIVGGILLGVGVILLSYVTQGKIGLADGICLMFLGEILGFTDVCFIFIVALFLVVGVAVILLVLKKAKWKTELPFLPFLFLGYVSVLLC